MTVYADQEQDALSGHGPTVMSFTGMVAAAHPIAARVGASILDQGGNAFDAAVAVGATLGVVEPFMSGLAGMGYATMWVAAERRVRVLDFVPPVPASFPSDRFTSRQELARGPMSVGLPGALAGWGELSRRYGRLPWHDVLAPAAIIAAEGFALSEYGVDEIATQRHDLSRRDTVWSEWRTNSPFGDGATFGQRIRQPALAATLRTIGEEGTACFYGGELGHQTTAYLQRMGGCLTMGDLASVKARWVEPAATFHGDVTVHVPPPPCEGFQILLALRMLADAVPHLKFQSVAYLDLVIRAIRLAAGARIAHNNPSADGMQRLLSAAHVTELQARLLAGEGRRGPVDQWMVEPDASRDFAHTTSFSVADGEGNLLCITQSLGTGFGSGLVVPGTGIIPNNFLHWADVQPESPNRSGPGSPLSMCMAPCIVTRDGQPVLALGTPGGYGILQTTVQALVARLDIGMPLRSAIAAPRMRLWDGSEVQLEDRFGKATIDALRRIGHDARPVGADWTMLVGGMQAIEVDTLTGRQTGAADPRRDGYVVPTWHRGMP